MAADAVTVKKIIDQSEAGLNLLELNGPFTGVTPIMILSALSESMNSPVETSCEWVII